MYFAACQLICVRRLLEDVSVGLSEVKKTVTRDCRQSLLITSIKRATAFFSTCIEITGTNWY